MRKTAIALMIIVYGVASAMQMSLRAAAFSYTPCHRDASEISVTYDEDGRMTSDSNKGITSIRYNAIGLPGEIKFGDGNYIINRYGADGTLLQRVEYVKRTIVAKIVPVGQPYKHETIENHIGPLTLNNKISKRLRVDTPTGFISYGTMHYYVKDYQGNVRQVVDADGVVGQDNHYYPYGMLMGESSNILLSASKQRLTFTGGLNPYRFGSKEYLTTNGANLLDFTARTYDPATLLFQTQDPKATKYTTLNSYLYCGSDPINRVDKNGMEWTDFNGNPIDDLSKIKRYIFYTDEFKNQAKIQYNEGIEQYGEGSVAVSNTGSTSQFSKDWSNIDGQVKDVMIMAHGKNQSINITNVDGDATNQLTSTGDGKTNGSKTKAMNIQDLNNPKGDISNATLFLYTCHSADSQVEAHDGQSAMTGSKESVFQVFSNYFDFKTVQGTASSVNYYGVAQRIKSVFTFSHVYASKHLQPYPINGVWIVHTKP